jgi:hypothetical protein
MGGWEIERIAFALYPLPFTLYPLPLKPKA